MMDSTENLRAVEVERQVTACCLSQSDRSSLEADEKREREDRGLLGVGDTLSESLVVQLLSLLAGDVNGLSTFSTGASDLNADFLHVMSVGAVLALRNHDVTLTEVAEFVAEVLEATKLRPTGSLLEELSPAAPGMGDVACWESRRPWDVQGIPRAVKAVGVKVGVARSCGGRKQDSREEVDPSAKRFGNGRPCTSPNIPPVAAACTHSCW